jgi:methyl-accepting chemotaxis protein
MGLSMWNKLALRKKLVAVIGGSLLVSVLISTLAGNNAMNTMLSERLYETEIPASLNSVANAIDKEISIPLAVSGAMANNSYLLDFVAAGEPEDAWPQVQKYLQSARQSNNALTAFLVSGTSKHYFTHDGLSRMLSDSDGWFYSFMDSGAP